MIDYKEKYEELSKAVNEFRKYASHKKSHEQQIGFFNYIGSRNEGSIHETASDGVWHTVAKVLEVNQNLK